MTTLRSISAIIISETTTIMSLAKDIKQLCNVSGLMWQCNTFTPPPPLPFFPGTGRFMRLSAIVSVSIIKSHAIDSDGNTQSLFIGWDTVRQLVLTIGQQLHRLFCKHDYCLCAQLTDGGAVVYGGLFKL